MTNTYCLACSVHTYNTIHACSRVFYIPHKKHLRLRITFINAYYKSGRQNPRLFEQTCPKPALLLSLEKSIFIFHLFPVPITTANKKLRASWPNGVQSKFRWDSALISQTIRWLQYNNTRVIQYNDKLHVQVYCRFLFDIIWFYLISPA